MDGVAVSRNLCSTDCYYCGDTPTHDEQPRPVTQKDCGVYFDEFEGMVVANATCPSCEARYLAWVRAPARWSGSWGKDNDGAHFDLSFRSTFNDEPGLTDLPKYEVERRVTYQRLGPFRVPEHMRR